MTAPDPKVSVVVPAYNSADTLERLLGSLDAQTLPQHEFEIVVVVDDGSTDGTFELLQRLQLDRPNLVAQRIEPSGWASRPRNVGTELARGEYVLYMDSDDTLYPDALRRGARDEPDHLGAEGRRRVRGGGRPHPVRDARGGRRGAPPRVGGRDGRAAVAHRVGLGAGSGSDRHLAGADHLLDPFVPTTSGGRTIEVVTVAVVDPATAALGSPLESASWDLWIETTWIGGIRRSRMRFTGAPRPALRRDRLGLARRNGEDKLALELGAPAELAVDLGRPPVQVEAGSVTALRIPLPAVAAAGAGELPVELLLRSATDEVAGAPLQGWLVSSSDRVELAGTFGGAPGRYVLDSTTELLVRRGGRARLIRPKQPWTPERVRAALGRRIRSVRR